MTSLTEFTDRVIVSAEIVTYSTRGRARKTWQSGEMEELHTGSQKLRIVELWICLKYFNDGS